MSSQCPGCGKTVYFDWHRPCLRCANAPCGKTLTPGSHSQHENRPYCTHCYGALFGPGGYGHGGSESHTFHQGKTTQRN